MITNKKVPEHNGKKPLKHIRKAPPKRRIGELLVDEGLISEQQLAEALKIQASKGGKTVENLVLLGHIDIEEFADFLAKQPGVASIDLSNYEIPEELAGIIPREFALKHEVFPIDKLGRLLTIGMACPIDSVTIKELEDITGLKVKPLLCSMEDIRTTIERYYPSEDKKSPVPDRKSVLQLESSLKLESLASMLRQLDSLPALPETVNQVKEVMLDPMSSTKDVARIVELDPTVAAKLLRLANSAAYGFPNRVDNIDMATTLLGLRETYSVVLSCEVVDFFSESAHFDYKAFWDDATFCATASRSLAKAVGIKQSSGIFAAGLLHAIGCAALAEIIPERYAKIDKDLRGMARIEAEEKLLGIGYPEAGFVLADQWGLPIEISESIRFHHKPELASEVKKIVAVVSLADAMSTAKYQEDDVEAYISANSSEAITMLGLDIGAIKDLYESVSTSLQE